MLRTDPGYLAHNMRLQGGWRALSARQRFSSIESSDTRGLERKARRSAGPSMPDFGHHPLQATRWLIFGSNGMRAMPPVAVMKEHRRFHTPNRNKLTCFSHYTGAGTGR